MASSSDQGISDLILLWLKLELVDPAGSNRDDTMKTSDEQ
jgi:hypothetical protein